MTQPLKKRKVNSNNINRKLLDFDLPKTCSVTLSSNNINCCLTCGKYFQGNSPSSPAYNHSITTGHTTYLNLTSFKCYTLPENTEWDDISSIQDIINYLNPVFTKQNIQELPDTAYDLNKQPYLVGYVGLNNLNSSHINVILQCLAHIEPIRDYYLLLHNSEYYETIVKKSPINELFSKLMCKIWSAYLFKNHIAPYDLINYISETKKLEQSSKSFLIWFINNLHSQLSKITKLKATILSTNLQGKIGITNIPIVSQEVRSKVEFTTIESKSKTLTSKFWLLSLDIPHNPLLTVQLDKIEEINLEELLLKYNGSTQTQINENEVRTYRLLQPLPPYLIFSFEKTSNSTVVKFPEILNMNTYVKSETPLKYKLISTIKRDLNNWSISIQRKDNWVCIKDLEVKDTTGELLFLDDNYIQVWKKLP